MIFMKTFSATQPKEVGIHRLWHPAVLSRTSHSTCTRSHSDFATEEPMKSSSICLSCCRVSFIPLDNRFFGREWVSPHGLSVVVCICCDVAIFDSHFLPILHQRHAVPSCSNGVAWKLRKCVSEPAFHVTLEQVRLTRTTQSTHHIRGLTQWALNILPSVPSWSPLRFRRVQLLRARIHVKICGTLETNRRPQKFKGVN